MGQVTFESSKVWVRSRYGSSEFKLGKVMGRLSLGYGFGSCKVWVG